MWRAAASTRNLDDAFDHAPVLEVDRHFDRGGTGAILVQRRDALELRPALDPLTRRVHEAERHAAHAAQQPDSHGLARLRAVEHLPVIAPQTILIDAVCDALQR